MFCSVLPRCFFFFFNDTATTEIYTLSLHDALPIFDTYERIEIIPRTYNEVKGTAIIRSEEHTSELQSPQNLVCRLLLEKKTGHGEVVKMRKSFSIILTVALVAIATPIAHADSCTEYTISCTQSSGSVFFLNDTAPPETSPLPLPAALPI